MTNPIDPVRPPLARRLLPIAAARPGHALVRGLATVAAWARLTSGSLRFGEVDVTTPLNRRSRGLLWDVLTEMVATIAVLAAADTPPAAGLAALQTLADRIRDRVAVSLPRTGSPIGAAEPPEILALEVLVNDLQPCLGRWQSRLAAWRDTGLRTIDWPLLRLCRADLASSRTRLVDRAWQLGIALGLPGLERLLPERPAVAPTLTKADDLAAAEMAAAKPPDPAALRAGWQIYVAAATRLPAREAPSAPGALGEAIAALDALAGEIRAGLHAMPPSWPNGGAADTAQALALALLTEGVEPFLTEWRPRYRNFLKAERSEAKWRRAAACRSALAATRDRCAPLIRALGQTIGTPPLPGLGACSTAAGGESPLQLPAPVTPTQHGRATPDAVGG